MEKRNYYCHSGFWYKTLGGFYRAYSFHAGMGMGPFFTIHQAFQFLIDMDDMTPDQTIKLRKFVGGMR